MYNSLVKCFLLFFVTLLKSDVLKINSNPIILQNLILEEGDATRSKASTDELTVIQNKAMSQTAGKTVKKCIKLK